jgi:hypothetical protein
VKPIVLLSGNVQQFLKSFECDELEVLFFRNSLDLLANRDLLQTASLIVLSGLLLQIAESTKIAHAVEVAKDIKPINPLATIWIATGHLLDVEF